MKPLTTEEKDFLEEIIENLYGPSSQLANAKKRFNDATLEKTEEALLKLADCDSSIKGLLIGMTGGVATIRPKGWLKDLLSGVAKRLSDHNLTFQTAVCKNFIIANYRTIILDTTHW